MEILCTVKAVRQIEQELAPKSSLLSPSTAVGQALPRRCLSLPFLPWRTLLFLHMGPEGSPLEWGAPRQQEQPVVQSLSVSAHSQGTECLDILWSRLHVPKREHTRVLPCKLGARVYTCCPGRDPGALRVTLLPVCAEPCADSVTCPSSPPTSLPHRSPLSLHWGHPDFPLVPPLAGFVQLCLG